MCQSHCNTTKLAVKKYVKSQIARSRKSHGKLVAACPSGPDSKSSALVLERTRKYANVNAIKHAPVLFRKVPSFS